MYSSLFRKRLSRKSQAPALMSFESDSCLAKRIEGTRNERTKERKQSSWGKVMSKKEVKLKRSCGKMCDEERKKYVERGGLAGKEKE